MPRHRPRRARSIRYDLLPSPVKTDITLWDHVLLKQRLLSKPIPVLRMFKRCQIESLTELPCFVAIVAENPKKAVEIAMIAAGMEIKIGDEPVQEKPC